MKFGSEPRTSESQGQQGLSHLWCDIPRCTYRRHPRGPRRFFRSYTRPGEVTGSAWIVADRSWATLGELKTRETVQYLFKKILRSFHWKNHIHVDNKLIHNNCSSQPVTGN